MITNCNNCFHLMEDKQEYEFLDGTKGKFETLYVCGDRVRRVNPQMDIWNISIKNPKKEICKCWKEKIEKNCMTCYWKTYSPSFSDNINKSWCCKGIDDLAKITCEHWKEG